MMQDIFFRPPVAAGFFLRELGLQEIFFKKVYTTPPPFPPAPQRLNGWPLSSQSVGFYDICNAMQ